jgi:hypothetical protein
MCSVSAWFDKCSVGVMFGRLGSKKRSKERSKKGSKKRSKG